MRFHGTHGAVASGTDGVTTETVGASPAEAAKAALVDSAATLADERFAADKAPEAGRFVATFYERVPTADIADRSPEELCGAALSLWRFAERRAPGEIRIRAFNPSAESDGWSSPHTIVEIVNDDMPFLVDSVAGAINGSKRVVHLVIHPIPTVERDDHGRLTAMCSSGGGRRESWMHVEIGRESEAKRLDGLCRMLAGVLGDVRIAVSDWQPMRETLQTVLSDLSRQPQPLHPAEIAEAQDFLHWLDDDNFTFLGYREYRFDEAAEMLRPPLGILSEPGYSVFGGLRNFAALPADVQAFIRRREALVVTKTDRAATVHRAVPMDAIGVRRFNREGAVVGADLFVGLFTSLAYSRHPDAIPLLRLKVRRAMARSGLSPASHDGKALLHILDTFPRDELFQSNDDELFGTAIGILNLQERQRVALFLRRDPLERFVSCLVYVPRERYGTELRQQFAAILAEAFAGRVTAFYTHLDDALLARVQFVVATRRGAVPAVDAAVLQQRLAEAARSWSDRVSESAAASLGEEAARRRLSRLRNFPVAYQARTGAAQAIADLGYIERVLAGAPLAASLHPREGGDVPGLRLYRGGGPVALSDVLPILENLGLRIVAEEPFPIETTDAGAVWVHEFTLAPDSVAIGLPAATRSLFEEAVVAIWTGTIENDGFNRLVAKASLSPRQTVVLRLYCKILRQAGGAFSQAYMEDTLAAHAGIARRLVNLFERRFDPALSGDRSLTIMAEVQAIDHALDAVDVLDEDRILRSYLTLILRTVRTNYFQPLASGEAKPYLSVKLASSQIDLLPLPRPLYEIYVYSPRVEGVHLRAGRVARGGIRWSDRKEDFRTEILGLMKAQTVKNAVIVPVGAKGGFIVKRPPRADLPDARDRLLAEGIECYKILIRGLLDLTDNIVAETAENHRVVPPSAVVRHDEDDPYLVVAADKGTATFSDIANGIAAEYGFWLGDAFASGGSEGYDHKALGITSRGAWELVKRHFRELGRDIETTPFTVIGVGDMSGDVFGNGMLRSRQTRLLAAFDHRHVFIDPDPDPEKSFAERRRLFDLPRSSWADYDPALISAGGGVFERSAKSIALSAEAKRVFAIAEDRLTPAELIRNLLCAAVDLLWFGGIGTFVKAEEESHAEVGDRANDALRADAENIRAKVIGEGANLGVTQRGRVAYALKGGRIDTDAIDNSAGVDTSDHEVNIKILLEHAIAAAALGRQERNALLAKMADDVCHLVLRDNYLQGAALSVAEAKGAAALDGHVRLIRDLERAGRLDRSLEFLPDDETLAARAAARQGLTRPELAVLLAHAKLSLDSDLLASDVPDLPELEKDLRDYFPPDLRERCAVQIAAHPLRREIIATVATNDLINRAGLTFVQEMRARTGRAPPEAARAYRIVRDAFVLPDWWAAIDALDNRVAPAIQIEMLLDIGALIEHAAAWLLRHNRLAIAEESARFSSPLRKLAEILGDLLPAPDRATFEGRAARLAAVQVPPALARRVAGTPFLAPAMEIADLAERAGKGLERVAELYYAAGARFALGELRAAALRLPAETVWQKRAVQTMSEELFALQAELTGRVLAVAGDAPDPLAAWAQPRAAALAPTDAVIQELRAAPAPDLAMMVVASRQLLRILD